MFVVFPIVAQLAQSAPAVRYSFAPAFATSRMLGCPFVCDPFMPFPMMTNMLGARKKLKILNAIICFILIQMMNYFIGAQGSSETLFHQPSVIVDFFSSRQSDFVVSRLGVKPRFWLPLSSRFADIATPTLAELTTTGMVFLIHAHHYSGRPSDVTRAT